MKKNTLSGLQRRKAESLLAMGRGQARKKRNMEAENKGFLESSQPIGNTTGG